MNKSKTTVLVSLFAQANGSELKTPEETYIAMEGHYMAYDRDPDNTKERLWNLHCRIREQAANAGKQLVNTVLCGQREFDFGLLREAVVSVGVRGDTMLAADLSAKDLTAIDETERLNRDGVVAAFDRHHRARMRALSAMKKRGAKTLGELLKLGWKPQPES